MKQTKRKLTALDMTYAAMFAALMAVGANIAQFIPPIGGVPITLQTFVALLAGTLLGSRLGAISMTVYMLVGLAGIPVFANFTGGLSTLVSTSFGFVLTFILLAYVEGKIIEKSKTRGFMIFLVASVVGLMLNYFLGTTYMYYAYKLWAHSPEGVSIVTYKMAWGWMLVPLPKDVILTIVAAVVSPRIYKVINKVQAGKSKRIA
ncbi:biotin transport system substrate-specific component [Pullulanibacillus pueri]|uniref:Biotin transporter n=1 Tax=Pullulanibacillus pueri TaxID=1437324 RepID=A0A8J2ZU78_9BACL|nr:biotin transporter BioY [Pullulanibacillus pueri]MBM7680763.1 biotin transport system substrate-specific component [Pullulanibacillus pueri]GGH78239.1 BioY family transporter [Pullulanibacillus pueri]